jgi:hypothetical protein
MNNTSFNPLEKFDKIEFRQQKWILIRKQLYKAMLDLSAGLEGGVSGHAGVFSNAMDVLK